jgi:diphthine-ammonia ligase
MANLEIIASWSGGKDSCLAFYKAMKRGYKIKYLLNFISKKYKRCCFHGIQRELISLQADLIGIPLFQKEVNPDMGLYEKEFKEAVNHLKKKKARGMVFGDIYLIDHKNWVERVCKDLKIKMIEPLWQKSPEKIAEEFIHLGFKAVVVSAKTELFGKKWIGHQFDREFLDYLKNKKIDLCGENGEFHTFVIDGPLFKRRIEIIKSRPIFKKGFWKHWFLDIQKWQVRNK